MNPAPLGPRPSSMRSCGCFRVLLDRQGSNLPNDAAACCLAWCPTMDLLAMSLPSARNVVVHRLSWQRLFVIQHKADVHSISWRPDGRALAVGLASGMVHVYDVENGAPLASFASHSASLRCMRWSVEDFAPNSCGSGSEASDDELLVEYTDHTARLVPAPGPLVRNPSGKADASVPKLPVPTIGGTVISGEKSPSMNTQLDVLVTVDDQGLICLNAGGVMPIMQLNLGQLLGTARPVVLQVALSVDFHRLTAVVGNTVDGPASETELRMVIMNTDLIWRRRREIQRVASHAQSIAHLLSLLHAAVAAAAEQWKQAIEPLQMKMESLSSVIREEHKLSSTVPEELLALVATGVPSPPLRDFLTQQMSEQRLKMMEKKMDTAMKAVQDLLLQNIRPGSECLAHRLSDLHGLSLWKERFEDIGIESVAVGKVAALARELVFRVEHAVHTFTEMRSNVRTFFTWISRVASLVVEDGAVRNLGSGKGTPTSADVSHVVSFLENGFLSNDLFAECFRTSGNPSAFSPTKLPSGNQLGSPPKPAKTPGGPSAIWNLSSTQCANLAQALQSLITQWEISCRHPSEVISHSCSLLANVLLQRKKETGQNMGVGHDESAMIGSPGRPHCQASSPSQSSTQDTSSAGNKTHLALHSSSQRDSEESLAFQFVTFSQQDDNNGHGKIHLMRFPTQGNIQIEAASVSVNEDIVGLEFYNDRQCAVLLAGEEGNLLGIFEVDKLPYASVWDTFASQGTASVSDRLGALGSEQEIVLARKRIFHHSCLQQMALSGSRGVACILAAQRRVLVLDLEDDPPEDIEEDGGA